MKSKYVSVGNLKVTQELLSFVNDELFIDNTIDHKKFWSGFDEIVHELAPINRQLLAKREILQKKNR
tara:strand:+ start:369 stop:569 length:201 start_codon:yes stop_codon:yes gene_type:complete